VFSSILSVFVQRAFSIPSQWWWPFVVLFVSVCFIITAISYWRMHAFMALLLASLVAGIMTSKTSWEIIEKDGTKKVYPHLQGVIEQISLGLGNTARDIAISIALASIIGMCLLESGAADKVVRRFLGAFGEKRAGWALLWSTYILSIPIFFDTMFMLMAPLAKALRLRTGKDYLLYVLCVCTGGMITHGLTIPHPGPLAMVETLKIDTGLSLAAGLLGGLIPAVVGYVVCVWLNSRNEIPLRDTELSSMESDKPESSLPSFFWSILPVVLPIVLISFSSLFKVMKDGALAADGRQIAWCVSVYETFGQANFDYVKGLVDFFGHKNIALLIGAGISLVVLAKQCGFGLQKLEQLVGPPLETAGMIILITSAGGAFGGMLRAAGVGDAVKASVGSQSVDLILLSFIVAAVIRVAQGSATVAMFTASSIIAPMLGSESIGYNHVYIYLAIGYGAMTCSWMNDSGFWVVSRLSGMTQRETLKTWSVLSICLAVSGLVVTMIFSRLLPLV